MKNIKNHVDLKYGKLTVWSQWVNKKDSQYRLMGFCKCDCGREKVVRISHLVSGVVSSCGCISIENTRLLKLDHGDSHSKEHIAWKGMKARCTNKNYPGYKYWGGRGIKICNRWVRSYKNFLEDMGRAPSQKHSVDRINVNGNYEPGNCRWATTKEQANNRRTATKSNQISA